MLNRKSGVPLYMQIANHITKLISLGYYPPGTRMSIRKLAQEYNVSRGVTENAIEVLKSLGLVEAQSKSGIFIKGSSLQQMMDDSIKTWSKLAHKNSRHESRELVGSLLERSSMFIDGNLAYYNFNNAEFNSYEPLRQAFEKMNNPAVTLKFSYYDKKGLPELRNAVCEHLAGYGINADRENVIILGSWVAALNVVAHSLFSNKTDLYMAANDNVGIMPRVANTGTKIVSVSSDRQGISPAEIETKLSIKRNSMLYLNPVNHFPTGITLTDGRRADLLKLVRKHNIPVFENDMLRDLWITPPPPPLKADDSDSLIIYTGSFANTFNSALHMAWIVAPPVIVDRLCDLKLQLYGLTNHVSELLAYFMLESGSYAECMHNIREKMPARRQRVNEILHKYFHNLAVWDEENSLFHIWLRFDNRFNLDRLFMENKDLIFVPGSIYYDKSCMLLNAVNATIDDFELSVSKIAAKLRKHSL